ncbi:MAG: pilus assembly protein TadG-related protein [Bifidobacteriaceae bacterium]|jgi:secretion/DNA translocation related TadE-like protein|nr:pilus assembly protein TadG-related protein [Bifidobacteriaceae bacterium]
MKRWRAWRTTVLGSDAGSGTDVGSGTVLGIGLIMMVGLFLSGVGLAGRVMYCQAVAQTGADEAAISAAKALNGLAGASSPCHEALRAARANSASLMECTPEGSDVRVKVNVETGVPLIAQIAVESRAGPAACGE